MLIQQPTTSTTVSIRTFIKIHDKTLFVTKKRYLTTFTSKCNDCPANKKTDIELLSEESYHVKRVSQQDVKIARICMVPTCLIKNGKALFMAIIPDNLNLSATTKHQCGNCPRCLALPISQGGCSKIIDSFIDDLMTSKSHEEAFSESKRLEKYSFVKFGIEVFGTKNGTYDFISIVECSLMDQ